MIESILYFIHVVASFFLICLVGSNYVNISFGSFIDVWLKLFVCMHIIFSLGWSYEILFKHKIKKNKNVQIAVLIAYVLISFVFEIMLFTIDNVMLSIPTSFFFISISILTSKKLYDEIKTL